VQVGETAPDFSLDDQNGQKVMLSIVRAAAPTVLVFYRGNW
jgi:peroxiredoxin